MRRFGYTAAISAKMARCAGLRPPGRCQATAEMRPRHALLAPEANGCNGSRLCENSEIVRKRRIPSEFSCSIEPVMAKNGSKSSQNYKMSPSVQVFTQPGSKSALGAGYHASGSHHEHRVARVRVCDRRGLRADDRSGRAESYLTPPARRDRKLHTAASG
jgi:hypothetical protein